MNQHTNPANSLAELRDRIRNAANRADAFAKIDASGRRLRMPNAGYDELDALAAKLHP